MSSPGKGAKKHPIHRKSVSGFKDSRRKGLPLDLNIFLVPAFLSFMFIFFMLISYDATTGGNYLINNFINTEIFFLIFFFLFPLAFLKRKRIPLSRVGLIRPEKRSFLFSVPIGVLLSLAALLFIWRISYGFPPLYEVITPSLIEIIRESFYSGKPEFWLFSFSFVVLGPFVEEFFFRGLLYNILRARKGVACSILLCTIPFAFFHSYLNIYIWYAFVFLFSIIACIVFEKTGSLVYCFMIHFAANIFALIVIIYSLHTNIFILETLILVMFILSIPLFYRFLSIIDPK